MKNISLDGEKLNATVISIGNFDGLHRGHKKLIEEMKFFAKKHKYNSLVFTFKPHPNFFFTKNDGFSLINTYEEKKTLFEKQGIDYYLECHFEEIFELKPRDFVEEILIKKLSCKILVVGEGYRFGKNGEGDLKLLSALSEEFSFELIIVPFVQQDGRRISSSRIRGLIAKGAIEDVNPLLTEPYSMISKVVRGNAVAGKNNAPTANIEVSSLKMYPKDGVYISVCVFDEKSFASVTSIGHNLTFSSHNPLFIESHILGFDQVIYDEIIQVFLLLRLRDAEKFPSPEVLFERVKLDIEETKKFFQNKACISHFHLT